MHHKTTRTALATGLFGLSLFFILCLFQAYFQTNPVWGRAGGGGHFSGGGGSHGGSSSGGSGGGFHSSGGSGYSSGGGHGNADSVWVVLVVIAIVVLVVIVILNQDIPQQSYKEYVIRNGRQKVNFFKSKNCVAELRKNDPDFSEEQLVTRVRHAFTKLQHAWCTQDLDPVRAFISDGVYERFQLQLAEQTDLGYRDQMDDLKILNCALVHFEGTPQYDVLTLCIQAQARDYQVRLANTRPQAGIKPPQDFCEYWTFMRRLGARTKKDTQNLNGTALPAGLLEGHCPNCGVGLALNQNARCEQCHSELRSGQFDWVLAEITQESEWNDPTPRELPGVEALYEQDPEFNAQHLEDLASVMFWRIAMSERLGNVDPLRKLASTGMVAAFTQEFQRTAGGVRAYYGERGVGSVDLLGVVHQLNYVQCVVQVKWAGRVFQQRGNEKPVRLETSKFFREILILKRHGEATTPIGKGLSSAHCPGCGAPQTNTQTSVCAYCSCVLNDVQKNWVLNEYHGADSAKAHEWFRALAGQIKLDHQRPAKVLRAQAGVRPVQPAEEPQAHASPWNPSSAPTSEGSFAELAWGIKVAQADGKLEPTERTWLDALARKRGVDQQQLELLLDAERSGTLVAPMPQDQPEALRWLNLMARSALADGHLDRSERDLLLMLGAKYGLPAVDINLLINRVRSDLYRETQQRLQDLKRASA